MDETTPIHLFKPLGSKTLYLLILKRSTFVFILLLILIGSFISSRFVPYQYTDILANIILTIIVILMISIIITIYIGWLEYKHYGISIDEDSFRITRGIFNEEEKGIAYRFIQEVRVERSLTDQAFGVSNIIIMVLGDQGVRDSELSKIELPCIEKNIASEIQDHILNRSEAHRVIKS